MCVCALTNASRVLLQSGREKEVSSRNACSVANLATFSAFVDPHSNFLFSKKKQLVTNRVSQSVSVIAATGRDQRAFSASALFSERLRGARSVKTDIIASLNVHANIEEITAQELSCLILCIIWFHQTTAQYNYKLVFLCRLASWKGELVMNS